LASTAGGAGTGGAAGAGGISAAGGAAGAAAGKGAKGLNPCGYKALPMARGIPGGPSCGRQGRNLTSASPTPCPDKGSPVTRPGKFIGYHPLSSQDNGRIKLCPPGPVFVGRCADQTRVARKELPLTEPSSAEAPPSMHRKPAGASLGRTRFPAAPPYCP